MLAGAVNFGDGKNFGSGTRQTGTALYGFLSLWMGGRDARVPRYFVGPDGHVQNRADLRCADDAEAIRLAKQLFDGRDVELWQLDRKIGTFRDATSSNASTLSQSVTLDYAR